MILIRTAEDLARALSQLPDPELRTLLQAQADRLAAYDDYDLTELAMFSIVQPGDEIDAISEGIGWSLRDDTGSFAKPVELIVRHDDWYELTFILSDDGYGMILYVPVGEETNRELLRACEAEFT